MQTNPQFGQSVNGPSTNERQSAAMNSNVNKSRIRLVTGSALVILGLLSGTMPGFATLTPVVQWSFENNLNDSSGTGNNGVLSGGSPTYVSGAFGQGISLTTAQSVDKLSASSLPTAGTAAWSENVWFNLSATPASLSYLAGFGANTNSTGGDARGYINYGAGYYFWGNGAPDVNSGVAYMTDSAWHMYTITSSGGASTTISMYLDGALVTSATRTLANPALNELHVGGTSFWGSTWTGKADEFTVWNAALSPAQVGNLFTLDVADVPEPSIVLLLGLGGLFLCRRVRQQA